MADHDFPEDEVYGVLFENEGKPFPAAWPSERMKMREGVTVAEYARLTGKPYREMTGAELNTLRDSLAEQLDAIHEELKAEQFELHKKAVLIEAGTLREQLRSILDGTHADRIAAANDEATLTELKNITAVVRRKVE